MCVAHIFLVPLTSGKCEELLHTLQIRGGRDKGKNGLNFFPYFLKHLFFFQSPFPVGLVSTRTSLSFREVRDISRPPQICGRQERGLPARAGVKSAAAAPLQLARVAI